MWLYPLICHCPCRPHSRQELPFRKGWVGRNIYGNYHLSPGKRSGREWSVICGVSFVQLYCLFHRRRCRTHNCQESPFEKGWIDFNPSGHYHLRPSRRRRRKWSVLYATFSSIFRHRCRVHGHLEAHFWKGWVCLTILAEQQGAIEL